MVGRFDLIIFDCDGVLVDSERLAVRTEAEILTGLGWPLSEAEIVEIRREIRCLHAPADRATSGSQYRLGA